uniref:Uncharacterized protein n=1 Tax=Aegilops tauschii subsp. strangulata TaxID=200361 RepID=A0A453Q1A5_AEGTS
RHPPLHRGLGPRRAAPRLRGHRPVRARRPRPPPDHARGLGALRVPRREANQRRGLITRNVKDAVDLFHQRFGMKFVPALSREFRPYKPDPAPLLHICSTWDIPPTEVIMVGDSLKDDIVCGKRAGAFTCLLDETGRYGPHDSLPEDVKPDFMVSSLPEVLSVLEEHFDLAPVSVAESRI